MKRYLSYPRVEGTASRQAHADLPAGTFEREISKEGFFGPAAHLYHTHPPTGWVAFEGPLQPHAFNFGKAAAQAAPEPWAAPDMLHNDSVRVRFWRSAAGRMDHLARNADGDELLFVHQGAGRVFLRFRSFEFRHRRLSGDPARHDVATRKYRAPRRAGHRGE